MPFACALRLHPQLSDTSFSGTISGQINLREAIRSHVGFHSARR
ncbi:hypothetical protein SAMN05444678_10424 [Sphingomonas sp. YR710]|jgi:hypothetical protein|nr:hypothetical protein SAMN05444678_10424 [Sphingomonas sp. YR710]